MDLNLPRVTGYELLEVIKLGELRRIPVIVLSGSEAEKDVRTCYELGANAYTVKPGSPDKAQRLVAAIEAFWFEAGRLPR